MILLERKKEMKVVIRFFYDTTSKQKEVTRIINFADIKRQNFYREVNKAIRGK